MRAAKSVILVVSMLLGTVAISSGDLNFLLSQQRHYRQHPNEVVMRPENPFLTGSQCYTLARLRDGFIEVTGCPLNGSPDWFPPVPLIGCEIGATGYIVGGDVGGAVDDNGNQVPDGIRDDYTHWEVTSVTPAIGIHYVRPDKAYLYSAPPSTLPRNQLFSDETTILYYNTQTESIREYFVSGYFLWRDYFQRGTMDAEMPTGEYIYRFPRLNDPDGSPADLRVTLHPIPEGYIRKNNVWQGLRFTRLNGEPLKWSADGYVEMDPRLNNVFEWAGNNQSNIFISSDVMYFSVSALAAPTPGGPTRLEAVDAATGRYNPLFPRFTGTPGTPRVRMDHALLTKFGVPGRFIPVQNPPLEGVVRLEILRNTPSTAVTYDRSYRCHQLPVRFINTYEGWAAVAFPVGTPAALRAPNADPDGDRYSNYREWQANTNPMNPAAPWPPGGPGLAFVPSRGDDAFRPEEGAPVPGAGADTGHWELRYPMASTWPITDYDIEFSPDLLNWQVIASDDPDWEIVREDASIVGETPHIIARSRSGKLLGNGFLRVKMTTRPDDSRPSDIPLE